MTRIYKIAVCILMSTCVPSINSMNIVNTLQPYDTLIRPSSTNKYRYQITGYAEAGCKNAQGYNDEGDHVNPLRIWNCEQNALAMLEGSNAFTPTGQLRAALLDSDNGIRGRFLVDGNFRINCNVSLATRFFFASDWSLGIYLPFYSMKLSNVLFTDLTPNLDNDDKLVHRLLTDHLSTTVQELGCLDIGDWQRGGPGDLALIIDWFRDFEQNKPILKCVRVNWRWGLVFPTGVRSDQDRLFAVPFGYDGAFAMPFGLELDVTLGSYFKAGIDVQLTQIFGNKRTWRIKTQPTQTELLLLHKAHAYKDYGLVQKFNLYAQGYHLYHGLSLLAGYQFLKQGDTEISLTGQEFSTAIANTSRQLEEFTMHHVIVKATWDWNIHKKKRSLRPELSLYARIPFNGKNVALVPMIGLVLSVDF